MTVFIDNMNLYLPLSFYSSIMFVTETVFISEQITQCKFKGLVEISDKLSRKLNVFSDMILQCWLNNLENVITTYGFEKKSGWVVLLERPVV